MTFDFPIKKKFKLTMGGLPIATFESRDTAELGKLIWGASNREMAELKINEVVG
jgi:hypothetical protein